MPLNFRQAEILTVARDEGRVTVDGLAARFDVTAQTIRRDLNDLCEAGKLSRVHGGAVAVSGVTNLQYDDRRALAAPEKDAIARACATQIPDGASLFLNIGTTTEAVARALLHHSNLMVITNNTNVAAILGDGSDFEVVVAGGLLRRSDGGLVGDITAAFMSQFKVDYAVIGASALDLDGDLLDFDFREVRVSQEIIRSSRNVFLVADATKFERSAPVRIGSLADIDSFFTDAEPPDPVRALCEDHGTALQVVALG